jgi:hypothetical protein
LQIQAASPDGAIYNTDGCSPSKDYLLNYLSIALKERHNLTMDTAHRKTLMMGTAHRKNITMGQSLVKNYVHIVFSTKYRQPLIKEFIEDELYSYLGGICKRLECQPIKIGGYYDHVHILCMLSKKIALMKLLEEVKSHSSL